MRANFSGFPRVRRPSSFFIVVFVVVVVTRGLHWNFRVSYCLLDVVAEIVGWECDLVEGRTLSEFKACGVSCCCWWNIVRKRKVGVFPKLDFGAGKVKTVCHRRRHRPRRMGWINGNQPVCISVQGQESVFSSQCFYVCVGVRIKHDNNVNNSTRESRRKGWPCHNTHSCLS